jgi:hypothetical protein
MTVVSKHGMNKQTEQNAKLKLLSALLQHTGIFEWMVTRCKKSLSGNFSILHI